MHLLLMALVPVYAFAPAFCFVGLAAHAQGE